MFDNTRKYRLNVGEIMSHGISACTTSNQYNILESFNIDDRNYSQLTIDELSKLDKPSYLKRVDDYISYLNIKDNIVRYNLLNNASTYDPNCNLYCKLNSDFLVYRFFNGIRIVNIGETKGEPQYKAYPLDADPSGYTWQTTPTFLNVDLNKSYIFEVRDYYQNREYCKVQRTVSLPLLIQSTTFVPEDKLIYIDEESCGTSSIVRYNNGTIEVNPILTNDEIVTVSYTLFADAMGDAQSCAELYCKPNGESSFINYCCNTSIDGSTSDIFTLRAGDKMCYNLNIILPTAGSCGCACFDINSVSGGGTTSPSIDMSRCCVTRKGSIPRVNISANLVDLTTTYNENTGKKTGCFDFTPSIPQNENITLGLSGLTNVIPTANNITKSSIKIKCKGNNNTNYDTILMHNLNDPQPLTDNISINYGDDVLYELSVTADQGTTVESCLGISDIFSSNGLVPSIGSSGNTSISVYEPAPETTISICKGNTTVTNTSSISSGYINKSPEIDSGQCVKIDFNTQLSISANTTSINNKSCVEIFCKKAGSTTFASKCLIEHDGNGIENCVGDFYVCSGDLICYNIGSYIGSSVSGTTSTRLELNDATGYDGVNATISSTKYKHIETITK